ncbi:MAG: type VI secretion system ATPase TssH [Archangium sp.]|nr:type VI secretion system ATPase TssH [Archangium sp.]
MKVNPKALFRKLTPLANRLVETGLGRATNSGVYEIVVEHLLQPMLEDESGEAVAVLAEAGVDRAEFQKQVNGVVRGLKAGNGGRPMFSDFVFRWIEDAWLFGSLELESSKLRSGVLMARFLLEPGRYTGETYALLDNVPADKLKKGLAALLATGKEANDAAATSSGGGGASGGTRPVEGGALAQFTTSFTAKAREKKIDPIFGRDREIRQMVDILARRRKNNPILVGDPGVGKTALVEGLAIAIVNGDVPESMKQVELVGLDLGLLQAGASVRGEFENRLKGVIEEIKGSPKPIILFIDEAHTLIGAGGNAGGGDAANLLKPALARGELRTVAATTWAEYKKYFEKDAALERRFQPVKVDEPNEEDAIVMMRGVRPLYEAAHGVTIRDEALVASVKLSNRYLASRQLPDKSVDLLDTAAARVKVALDARPEELISAESRLAALTAELASHKRDIAELHPVEKEILDTLEASLKETQATIEKLRARWQSERDAVKRVRAARLAATQAKTPEESSKAATEVKAAQDALAAVQVPTALIHPEVGADAVAKVLAGWTGIPIGKMKTEAVGTLLAINEKLHERVRGQPSAIKTVAETLQMATAGVRNPDAPRGVLLFVGPSGVGKTETALALADAMYGGDRFLTVINMTEFQEKHSVSRLIGSPPGYVGYGEGGRLTEAVRQRPYSVVLLDECEKADLEVMNLFYQVFDKGLLNDGEGRAVDFKNTVVIMTSNLATEQLMKIGSLPELPPVDSIVEAIRPALSKHFKPALLARMTIVPYLPMTSAVLKEIVKLKVDSLVGRVLTAQKLKMTYDPIVIDELAARCAEGETGARNVEHVLSTSLLPELSRELLTRIASGEPPTKLHLGLTEDKKWSYQFAV